MFKTMKSEELMTVNGGLHMAPLYNYNGYLVKYVWASYNVKYYKQNKDDVFEPVYY